jgi:glucose dehydrogenase
MIRSPAAGDWLMWRRTLESWGYSPLDTVNRKNVGELKLIWSRDLGPGLQEGTPLVHDGVMYMPNPGDIIQAINGVTGDLIWEYHRKLPEDLKKVIGFSEIKRNVAIYGNLIINTSGDVYVYGVNDKQHLYHNSTLAMDPETGKVTDNPAAVFTKKGETLTICPSVVKMSRDIPLNRLVTNGGEKCGLEPILL